MKRKNEEEYEGNESPFKKTKHISYETILEPTKETSPHEKYELKKSKLLKVSRKQKY